MNYSNKIKNFINKIDRRRTDYDIIRQYPKLRFVQTKCYGRYGIINNCNETRPKKGKEGKKEK